LDAEFGCTRRQQRERTHELCRVRTQLALGSGDNHRGNRC
jgi:hypothetical protein